MSGTDRKSQVSYFIFDIVTIADGELVSKIRYPKEGLSAADALKKY